MMVLNRLLMNFITILFNIYVYHFRDLRALKGIILYQKNLLILKWA
jgi:hypothetical protein